MFGAPLLRLRASALLLPPGRLVRDRLLLGVASLSALLPFLAVMSERLVLVLVPVVVLALVPVVVLAPVPEPLVRAAGQIYRAISPPDAQAAALTRAQRSAATAN